MGWQLELYLPQRSYRVEDRFDNGLHGRRETGSDLAEHEVRRCGLLANERHSVGRQLELCRAQRTDAVELDGYPLGGQCSALHWPVSVMSVGNRPMGQVREQALIAPT